MGRIPSAHPAARTLHGEMSVTHDRNSLDSSGVSLYWEKASAYPFPTSGILWDPLPEGQARKKGVSTQGLARRTLQVRCRLPDHPPLGTVGRRDQGHAGSNRWGQGNIPSCSLGVGRASIQSPGGSQCLGTPSVASLARERRWRGVSPGA